MRQIKDIIPAQTGVVIMIEQPTLSAHVFRSVTSDETVDVNYMCGYAGPADTQEVSIPNDASIYILSVKKADNSIPGFYKKTKSFLVHRYRAYLSIPSTTAASIRLRFVDKDNTTEIMEVPVEALNMGGEIYDLSGRRVEKATKGVYIVNGKKVIF